MYEQDQAEGLAPMDEAPRRKTASDGKKTELGKEDDERVGSAPDAVIPLQFAALADETVERPIEVARAGARRPAPPSTRGLASPRHSDSKSGAHLRRGRWRHLPAVRLQPRFEDSEDIEGGARSAIAQTRSTSPRGAQTHAEAAGRP